jgi:hypothetical protein
MLQSQFVNWIADDLDRRCSWPPANTGGFDDSTGAPDCCRLLSTCDYVGVDTEPRAESRGGGWSASLVGTLAPYCLPKYEAGRIEFFGVPPIVAAGLLLELRRLVEVVGSGVNVGGCCEVVGLGEAFAGADVRYQGFIIVPPRSDERIEFTAFTVALEHAPATYLEQLRQLGDASVLIDNQSLPARLMVTPSRG